MLISVLLWLRGFLAKVRRSRQEGWELPLKGPSRPPLLFRPYSWSALGLSSAHGGWVGRQNLPGGIGTWGVLGEACGCAWGIFQGH